MTGTLIATFAVQDADDEASVALQGRLWASGCSGLWERSPGTMPDGLTQAPEREENPLLDAYFLDEDRHPGWVADLETLAGDHGARFVGLELLMERDWMEAHRRLAQPVLVGQFMVDPREPDDPAGEASEREFGGAKWHLRVPARQAFGTGSHETTRLTLRALSELDVAGASVIDVGCGSGVLSFAAHHLGAARVVGYDLDTVAAFASRVNAGLNRLELGSELRFVAGTEAMLKPGWADILLVNVLPEKIEGAERALSALVRGSGTVVLSGLLGGEPLPTSTVKALERWRRLDWHPAARREEGEWIAFRLGRGAGARPDGLK